MFWFPEYLLLLGCAGQGPSARRREPSLLAVGEGADISDMVDMEMYSSYKILLRPNVVAEGTGLDQERRVFVVGEMREAVPGLSQSQSQLQCYAKPQAVV